VHRQRRYIRPTVTASISQNSVSSVEFAGRDLAAAGDHRAELALHDNGLEFMSSWQLHLALYPHRILTLSSC